MSKTVSVSQVCNAVSPAHNGQQLALVLASLQADVAALAAGLKATTTQMDANVVAGHPYTVAANNPVPNTLP